MSRNKALVAANVATVLFGMSGLFGRWVSVSSIGITFGRVVFSSVVLYVYCRITKEDIRVKERKDIPQLLCMGILLAVHWVTFMEAVKLASVAVSTITFSTFPLFLTFLEPLVFKTELKARNIFFAVLIVIGIGITAWGTEVGGAHFMGILVGMVSAVTYAILQLFNKSFTSKGYNGTVISMYEQGLVAVILLPVIIATGFHPTGKDILLLLILGIFTTAIAHTTMISSMKVLPAQLVGICNSMETVYGIALAALLLGEMPSINEVIGAIIVTGVVVAAQKKE